jgi:hypothetical protein
MINGRYQMCAQDCCVEGKMAIAWLQYKRVVAAVLLVRKGPPGKGLVKVFDADVLTGAGFR